MAEILLLIFFVFCLEGFPGIFENLFIIFICKLMIYFVMDKDNIFTWLNLLNIATFIYTFYRIKLLCSPVGYHFLFYFVSLIMFISICISHCSYLLMFLVVIALCMKNKMAIYTSYLIVRRLKVLSILNMA